MFMHQWLVLCWKSSLDFTTYNLLQSQGAKNCSITVRKNLHINFFCPKCQQELNFSQTNASFSDILSHLHFLQTANFRFCRNSCCAEVNKQELLLKLCFSQFNPGSWGPKSPALIYKVESIFWEVSFFLFPCFVMSTVYAFSSYFSAFTSSSLPSTSRTEEHV